VHATSVNAPPNLARDLSGVGMVRDGAFTYAINARVPARDLPEFVMALRGGARPDELRHLRRRQRDPPFRGARHRRQQPPRLYCILRATCQRRSEGAS
jgi:hypothetical protein